MENKVGFARLLWERLFTTLGLGLRAKLIVIFVVIKIVPLLLIALVAWNQSLRLGDELSKRTEDLTVMAHQSLAETGNVAINDAVKALDERAREDLERMSTDTAGRVASFLYARDADLLFAASFKPDADIYRSFINKQLSPIVKQGEWKLAEDQKSWVAVNQNKNSEKITSSIIENANNFSYRPPEEYKYEQLPLYKEITFVDLKGQELIKVSSDPNASNKLQDVSQRKNTFIKAETYFSELKKLKPGEIYVSDVIGAYVGSKIIGAYTPERAEKAGLQFEPQQAAYAGKENPLGKRFEGIVRWATPVLKNGAIIGYVTLALDHDHLMEFTSHLMPTNTRYTEIPDASSGNYAFIWDHKGRNIVHPRHFSIAGYDPETGDPQVPWLEDRIYKEWQESKKSYADFIEDVPTFMAQSNSKKPAAELSKQGLVGLDCRYLNFAAQCTGWFDLTQKGGSGSFLILWSGLWKINTAAAIPYYTGQYANSPRGFGFVTIGAGVDDFHRPATETKKVIDGLIDASDKKLKEAAEQTQAAIKNNLLETAMSLSVSTGIMIVLVIIIAILIASSFTGQITKLVKGVARFRSGERHFRFNSVIKDELGTLADSFDDMADNIVDSVKGFLVITDLERRFIYCNAAGLAAIKKDLPEVLNKPYENFSIFPKGSKYCPITSLLKGTEPEVLYCALTNKYYRGTASYFNDQTGKPIGYIISTSDVTKFVLEQKQIEAQRALLDTIFSSSPDLIAYKNSKGKYLAVNPRFQSIFGKSAEEIINHSGEDLFPPELAKVFAERDQQAIKSKIQVYTEEEITFADGHTEIIDTVRTPVFDALGKAAGILLVGRNVSLRVAAENDLKYTQLELKKAVSAANKANESKSEFLARMSHEIRTPMNAIIGMTNITTRKLNDPELKVSELQAHVRQIEMSSNHLLGLINDILDISKIEAGKIELTNEPFDLPKLIRHVANIIKPRCLEKNISFNVSTFEPAENQVYNCDPLRLRQILINLLGNAVKFTPECGVIDFSIKPIQQKNGMVLFEFSITDTGVGIPKSAINKLFLPFEQCGSHINKQYGGTGLGLSISSSIVKLLGGEIKVSSEEGKGSCFSFAIWMQPLESCMVDEVITEDISALVGKKVLLVDDVDINRFIVAEQLSSTGLIIEEATDGTEALEFFANSKVGYFDIILMDVQMPQMSGHEASRLIRQLNREDAASVPIIALTANAFKEDVESALENGMNAHLAKPLEHDKLMQVLVKYLCPSKK